MNILSIRKKKATLLYFLDLLGVPNTIVGFREKSRFQPNANSLMGMADILNDYKVDNISVRISPEDLCKVDPPYIAQLERPQNEFVVVIRSGNDQISYLNDAGLEVQEGLDLFTSKWSGIIMMGEANEASTEADYVHNHRLELLESFKAPVITIILAGFLLFFGYQSLGSHDLLAVAIHFVLYLAGAVICFVLLLQMVDKNNALVNRVCNLNKSGNCNNVLESPAAKLLGIVSWSEIGFIYFVGCLLSLVFAADGRLLMILNCCALPYTAWSIYYQWRIAREWCILCLSIQGLLWSIFLVDLLWSGGPSLQVISFQTMVMTAFCFLIPMAAVWLVLPYIHQGRRLGLVTTELNTIKGNESIFKAVLSAQPKVRIADTDSSVFLGNPDAGFVITLVTNPYCGPCADVHKKLDEMRDSYGQFIRLQTIYAGSGDKDNDRNKAIRTLIAAYLQHGREESESIYKEWYREGKNDIEAFNNKYPSDLTNPRVEEIFESHLAWCNTAGIKGTPTLYVNGHELPGWYRVEDLKYFIAM